MAVTMGGASLALAQSGARPERPYRGLFGSGVGDAEQSLVGTANLGAGYDTNVLAAALGRQRLLRPGDAGGLVQGSAGLNYTLARERYQLGGSAGTSARYYPNLSNSAFRTHNGSMGGRMRLLDRPAVTADATVRYQPFTFLGALGDTDTGGVGESALPDAGVVPTMEHYLTYQGGLGLSQPLSRRVTFSSNYQYRYADRRDRGFSTQGVGAQLRVALSGVANLMAGYRLNEGKYASGRTFRSHSPIIGIDMAKALSLTRRTTASFGGGSSAIQSQGRSQIRATGNASLVHEIGRTWQVSSGYGRSFRFVETFDEPIFSDAVNVVLSGLVSRRVQASVTAGASKGQVGLTSQRSFTSISSSAGMSVALSRHANLNLGYTQYRYTFDQDVLLPEGVLNEFGRHSVNASVGFWVPLATQRRRP